MMDSVPVKQLHIHAYAFIVVNNAKTDRYMSDQLLSRRMSGFVVSDAQLEISYLLPDP